MSEIFAQLERVRATGAPAALATLLATSGTTPKRAGATMCVSADGTVVGSVTIGGCVDARVIEAAPAVIAGAAPRVLTMPLGDEDAWALGLTCGGTVELLLQRVDPARDDDSAAVAYAAARALHARGQGVMVVAVVSDGGGEMPLDQSASRRRLLVAEDGTTSGSLGAEALDVAARASALERIGVGTGSSVARVGDRRLYFEHLAPPPIVVIYGASEVAIALVGFARELGMRTIVVDPRERFASRERFPLADELHVGMASELAEKLPRTRHTAAVLLAHDYKVELPVLRALLRSDVGYLGLLAGRKRGAAIRAMLADEGFPDDEVARIRTPIGLDIGAESAAEIALAVAGEIIAQRRGGTLAARR